MLLVTLQVGDLSDFNYLVNNQDVPHPITDHGEVRICSLIPRSQFSKFIFSPQVICVGGTIASMSSMYPGLRSTTAALQEASKRAVKKPGTICRVELSIDSKPGSVCVVYKSQDENVYSLPDLPGKGGGIHSIQALFSLFWTPDGCLDGSVSVRMFIFSLPTRI